VKEPDDQRKKHAVMFAKHNTVHGDVRACQVWRFRQVGRPEFGRDLVMQDLVIDIGQEYVEEFRHVNRSDVNGPRV